MSDAIIVAIISGAITLIGIYISSKQTSDNFSRELDKKVAVIDTKIEMLQQDVKEHNHYAKMFSETMPVVQEQIKVANHRIDDIEKKVF